MPWILDELMGRGNHPVDFRYDEDQDLPRNISLPKIIPDRALWPIKITVASSHKVLPDFTSGANPGTIITSEKFKQTIEEFEPDVHHFIPLQLTLPDGGVLENEFYLFKMGGYIEGALIEELSDVNRRFRKGKDRGYFRSSLSPRLMWNANKVAGRHLWADEHFAGAVTILDELYARFKSLGLKGFVALESRIKKNF